MDKKVLTNNIVLLFNEPINVTDKITTDVAKGESVSVFSELNPNPIQVQIGDIQTVFIPEAAINLQIQKNSIIVSDQAVGNFDNRRTDDLLRLAWNLKKKVNAATNAYGFNFIYEIIIENHDEIWRKLSVFAGDNIPKIDDREPKIIPTIAFESEENSTMISISPSKDFNTGIMIDTINITANVNYMKDLDIDLSDLTSLYKEQEIKISGYIDKVFNNE